MAEICRDLNKLNPNAKLAAEYLIEACEAQGLALLITETLRTTERQQELYAQGRTKPGSIVTQLDGVKQKSIHQYGNAFDVCQNIRGKEYDIPFLQKVGKLGEEIGLEWGGSWKGFVDMPHFQLNAGVTPKRIVQKVEEPTYNVTKTKLKLNGVVKEVDTILLEGLNHVKLRDLADSKIKIDYKDGKVYINDRVFTGKSILFKDTNYLKLRDLPQDMFVVGYVNGLAELSVK